MRIPSEMYHTAIDILSRREDQLMHRKTNEYDDNGSFDGKPLDEKIYSKSRQRQIRDRGYQGPYHGEYTTAFSDMYNDVRKAFDNISSTNDSLYRDIRHVADTSKAKDAFDKWSDYKQLDSIMVLYSADANKIAKAIRKKYPDTSLVPKYKIVDAIRKEFIDRYHIPMTFINQIAFNSWSPDID